MLSANSLQTAKSQGHKIAMVTAYDYPFAQMAERAGADMILVGDSGANVVLGMASTRDIGMEEMLVFVSAARRGAPSTHIIGDLPYESETTPELALHNSRRMIAAGATSVKLEGARFEIVQHLCSHGIEVVGHLGLLPQTATSFKKAARETHEQEQLLRDALELERLGICALVLEHIPEELGQSVSEALRIPVIGIGAGSHCDGQVMVLHDLLGISERIPSLAFGFGQVRTVAQSALQEYVNWVRSSSDLKALRSTESQNLGPYGGS